MLDANVLFNAEVIHDEDEHDEMPFVMPKAEGCIELVVAHIVEACFEELVGKDACLGKAVDAFDYLEVDPTVVDMVHEIVFINKLLRDIIKADENELLLIEGSAEVYIADVEGTEFSTTARENAVDHEFDKLQQSCFGASDSGLDRKSTV